MKSANHNGNISLSELTSQIEGAGELIGLDTDQTDEPRACRSDRADRAFDIDKSVALVAAVDVNLNLRSKDFRPGTLRQQTM
jgi:hypothetical protein